MEITNDFVFFDAPSRVAVSLGATYVEGRRCWKIPINLDAVASLFKTFPENEDLRVLRDKLQAYYVRASEVKNQEDTQGDERLRPYQRVDVEFIKMRQNTGVFNEQRTGKTPTVLVAFGEELCKGKNIIVCPSGLRFNWEKELFKWTPVQFAKVVKGTPSERNKTYVWAKSQENFVLITSYETLRGDLKLVDALLKDVGIMLIDEAHRLRNHKTLQSKAVLQMAKKATNVIPMTGTPAVNHPSDIYGILKVLKPSKFTSYWNFVDRYFGYFESPFGRRLGDLRKDRKDEFQNMLGVLSVQRKRRDVMKWIPKILVQRVKLYPDKAQETLFSEIINMSRLNGEVIPNALAQLTRLRQVALDPNLVMDTKKRFPKEEYILDFIEDNPDESIIIFSAFTSFLKRLQTRIKGAQMLTGENTLKEKQSAVDALQSGKSKVLLANILAGGVGWTLDKVSTIIFADESFNPMDNEQAKDRFIPTDPNAVYEPKQIIYLELEGSIDERVSELLKHKMSVIKYVNDYGLSKLLTCSFEEGTV